MKIETALIPVNLLIIKACFRFLTFDVVQDKNMGCGFFDFGLQIENIDFRQSCPPRVD